MSSASSPLCALNLAIMWLPYAMAGQNAGPEIHVFLRVFLKEKNSAYTALDCTLLKLLPITSTWDAFRSFVS